ncbi:MAG: triphosphoribosyl-dephospho-CoA synthase [Gammaproteobacteria bacterium]|nr:triphosphoribosyl-dephospho-CoA synthase [Gammaproteobacteria bacterium]
MTNKISGYIQCYQQACLLELRAIKPGNVGYHSSGHGMTVEQFELSSKVSAAPLFSESAGVGERILKAVKATQVEVADNTNLGIILLVAPIAEVLVNVGYSQKLRDNLSDVLSRLSISDAKHCYKAIQQAMPGGMGEVDEQDISSEPDVSLLKAMQMSAERDRIAYQFANGFSDIFEHNLSIYREYLEKWGSQEWAATAVFLSQWLREPDSLIIRKNSLLKAREISDMIAPLAKQVLASRDPTDHVSGLLSLDSELKSAGINPGTTADLTVVTLFVAMLERQA